MSKVYNVMSLISGEKFGFCFVCSIEMNVRFLLFSHATMPIVITFLALLGACCASGQRVFSLSQSYIIRNQDVVENYSMPFSTHFMCSIHSQVMGFTTYWINDTTGACSMGELANYWQQDSSGIRVFVENEANNGKNF